MEHTFSMLDPSTPIAIYMEGATGSDIGKMGFGVLRYSANPIVCVIDSLTEISEIARRDGFVPIVSSVSQAVELGAKAMILGIAPSGGLIPPEWWPDIDLAVSGGLSIVNGLHDLVAPRYSSLSAGQWVWDIRVEPADLPNGTGLAAELDIPRVLMIGTDMAVGKMTAGLELMRSAQEASWAVEFVATGQIGITVTGRGVPLDAVRVDFASGAIEREVLAAGDRLHAGSGQRATGNGSGQMIIIEGQGALIHPSSTANLPLLRGACPTHLILCHRAGQTHVRRLPDIAIPPLREYASLYEDLASACGAFSRPVTVGVALNTAHLDEKEASAACRHVESITGWPCVDPVRHGCDPLVEAISTA